MTILNKYAAGSIAGVMALLASRSAGAEQEVINNQTVGDVVLGGGLATKVLEQEVPIGVWTIRTEASVVTSAEELDIVSCELHANGQPVEGSHTEFQAPLDLIAVTPVVDERRWVATVPTRIELVCWHFAGVFEAHVNLASLVISGQRCELPSSDTCLPGHELVPNGVVLINDVAVLPDPKTCADAGAADAGVADLSPPTAEAADEQSGAVVREEKVCVAVGPAPANDCLAPDLIYLLDADRPWFRDKCDPDYPLINTCASNSQYRWSSVFGYEWCSENRGR